MHTLHEKLRSIIKSKESITSNYKVKISRFFRGILNNDIESESSETDIETACRSVEQNNFKKDIVSLVVAKFIDSYKKL